MAITKVELANMLLGVESTKKAAAKIKTSTIVGTAHNDSHDGYVLVDLGGDVISVDGKQYVSLATTSDVRAGDKVYVMLRGADGTAMGATVIGAAGGGDRTKGDIAAAAADAAAAQTDASSAISMVNAVKATADKHESQIDAIQKDISDYKASAEATYATKTEVDSKTGAITKTLSADYTKTADLGSTDAVKDAKAAGTAAQASIDGMQIGGRNLIVQATLLDGCRIGMDGAQFKDAYHSISDYIKVAPSASYTMSEYQAYEGGGFISVAFYDADKNFVSRPSGALSAAVLSKTYESPENAAYARVSFPKTLKSAVKFERGTKATDWTPAPEDTDSAVADARKAGTDAAAALADYKGVVTETYAEKTELTEAVNQLSSTMTSQYTAFTDYRKTNDTALSKAQTDATNAQSTIDSYKSSNDKAVADAKAAGTTAQNQLSSYKSSNDAAVKDAKKAGTDAQSQLGSYKTATDQRLDELKNIADNAIESWYLKGAPTAANPPASSWTTDALKKQHAGDLYMDTDTGYSYRWSGTAWVQVKDSDVTKALTEIANIKTDYATKTELEQTNTSLSAKVEDSLSTAKTYASGLVSTEVTQRNAAITAKANEITQQVSKTYTKSETFSAYQSDADSRIATANSNASTAKSTAQTAAADAATAKTNASSAVSTANSAKSTAQTASTNASNAVSTANSANSKSDSAVSTAASASSTANAAKSTVDSMKLGGRNLLKGTSMDVVTGAYPSSSYKDYLSYTTIDVADGDTYTLSFDAKSTHAGDILRCYFYSPNTTLTGVSSTGMKFDSPDGYLQVKLTADWQRYWCTWTQSATAKQKTVIPFRCQSGNGTGTVSMRGVKLEAGNKATDWTPAPEDTDSAVADAKKAGTDAQTSANNAQKAADKAQASADDTAAALAKAAVRIRIDGTPMADGTSQLMAHVYVGNDEVSSNAIAKLGTLVWKMDGVADRRGVTTYTAQTGKFVTCRLEA